MLNNVYVLHLHFLASFGIKLAIWLVLDNAIWSEVTYSTSGLKDLVSGSPSPSILSHFHLCVWKKRALERLDHMVEGTQILEVQLEECCPAFVWLQVGKKEICIVLSHWDFGPFIAVTRINHFDKCHIRNHCWIKMLTTFSVPSHFEDNGCEAIISSHFPKIYDSVILWF